MSKYFTDVKKGKYIEFSIDGNTMCFIIPNIVKISKEEKTYSFSDNKDYLLVIQCVDGTVGTLRFKDEPERDAVYDVIKTML